MLSYSYAKMQQDQSWPNIKSHLGQALVMSYGVKKSLTAVHQTIGSMNFSERSLLP
jgi:hypothetical protein